MINIVLRTNGIEVPESLSKEISNLLKDIDLQPYKIYDYTIYVVFDMDSESIKNVLDLDGNNKFILFQNIPEETNYDLGFEAALSKFRIRLQRFKLIDGLSYNNIVFIFDFSQKSVNAIKSNTDNKENNDRRAMFVPVEPKFKMESVIMSEEMRAEIDDALSIIRNRDLIYNEWGFQEIDPQARAVLSFYGPGGTGKTKCAHAVASALGRKILCVNYANIESMWAGESPKNLISAFNVAQESNAVLFMDEADSFLGKRITNVTSGHDQSINSLRSQMLILLEEFEGVVIFGTNLVENFDKAFETRILKSIKFDLPDESSRIKLFKLMIPQKVPFSVPLSEDDYLEFAKQSENFSGREIKNTILETLSKGAKDNISSFSPQMFIESITSHAESLNKLREAKEHKEATIEKALTENILSESERIYHESLIHIAIYAMKSDGIIDEREKVLILRMCKFLDLDTDIIDIDSDDIPSIPVICEHFSTAVQKCAALDLACKIVTVDNHLGEQEITFIRNLYGILGYNYESFTEVQEYLQLLMNANEKLLSFQV